MAVRAATIGALALLTPTYAVGGELECIARAVYHEARGTSLVDRYAVAAVVVNRMGVQGFPSSACKVIAQPGQFPWFAKNPPVREKKEWSRALQVAGDALSHTFEDPTFGATYFWNTRDAPGWGKKMKVTLKTEAHRYAKPNRKS